MAQVTASVATRGSVNGMRTFVTVWVGQLVSTIGSGLTGFALGVWVYQQTDSTTMFALNILAYTLPTLLMSPLAGALVDRFDRRWMMIISDSGAGLSTLLIWLLYASGNLAVWHVLLATALNATFTSFQWPAYSAATTLLVPKKHLGRAGGMVQIGEAVSQLLAPAVAGGMYVAYGLDSVVLVDFATYLVALGTLMAVRFPVLSETRGALQEKSSLWDEAAFGWRYIIQRRGLFGLLIFFALINFFMAMFSPLLTPMLLEFASADQLGWVYSIIGLGMLFGTLVMSAWGGPKRRIYGILVPSVILGIGLIVIGIRPSLTVVGIAGFVAMFFNPILNGSSQALWQSKVVPEVQGRVFAVRRMIAWSSQPLGILLAGPLADHIFEPLLLPGGALAESLGVVFGVGDGRGTGLLFAVLGLATILGTLWAYLYPPLRHVERDLPDVVEDSLPS